jgi:hypothetical protein
MVIITGTEFDHTGNVKTTAGEFSKHQLCVVVCNCSIFYD